MKVYIKKSNTDTIKEFIIPKNESFNCKNWVYVTINLAANKFIAEKMQFLDIKKDEWEIKENYTFPSSLLHEFLRNDYFEMP